MYTRKMLDSTRVKRTICSVIVGLVIIVALAPMYLNQVRQGHDLSGRVIELEMHRKNLEDENKSLKSQLDETKQEILKSQTDIASKDDKYQKKQGDFVKMTERLTVLQKENVLLKDKLTKCQAESKNKTGVSPIRLKVAPPEVKKGVALSKVKDVPSKGKNKTISAKAPRKARSVKRKPVLKKKPS